MYALLPLSHSPHSGSDGRLVYLFNCFSDALFSAQARTASVDVVMHAVIDVAPELA